MMFGLGTKVTKIRREATVTPVIDFDGGVSQRLVLIEEKGEASSRAETYCKNVDSRRLKEWVYGWRRDYFE